MRRILLLLSITFIWLSCSHERADFILVNGSEPESLDPHLIEGIPENRIYNALFEPLLSIDPQTAKPVPALADSWEISDDLLTYTFHIREDAVWSDGVKITAQTIVDSWLRILDPNTAAEYAWFPALFLKGGAQFNSGETASESVAIRALDTQSFQFELLGPLPYVLDALTHYSFGAVPLHVIEKYGDSWTSPENIVSNGAFVLDSWKPQSIITVIKNERYWNKENVTLNSISFLPVEDSNTALNMFKNGEVDWITDVPSDQIDELFLRDDFHSSEQLATYYLHLQNQKEPFNNALVRRAFSLSIDREKLAKEVAQGGQIPAYGLVPPLPNYASLDEQIFSPKLAQDLLAEAGYPGGEGFPTVQYIYNTNENHKKIAEFLQQAWKEILGVDVELANLEWKTYLVELNAGNYNLARRGWTGDYVDPNTFLDQYMSQNDNGVGYKSEEFDKLVFKASLLPAGEERIKLLREADTVLTQKDVAILPLYYQTTVNLIDTEKWGGWYTNIKDSHSLKYLYEKQ